MIVPDKRKIEWGIPNHWVSGCIGSVSTAA